MDFAAVERFDWSTAIAFEDVRYDYGELRVVHIGLIDGGLHIVVTTPRGLTDRVISARRATPQERRLYAQHTKPKG